MIDKDPVVDPARAFLYLLEDPKVVDRITERLADEAFEGALEIEESTGETGYASTVRAEIAADTPRFLRELTDTGDFSTTWPPEEWLKYGLDTLNRRPDGGVSNG